MAIGTPRPPRVADNAISPRPPRLRLRRFEAAQSWVFLAPALALIITFFIVPLGLVVFMSGSDWSLFRGFSATNFPANFVAVFKDPVFASSLGFTLKYTLLTTIILMPVSFFLSLLVQETRKWNKYLRTAILLPSALGIASSSLLFYALYSPQVGPLNPLLERLGLMSLGESILGTPNGALWATVLLVVWRFTGYYMLLTLIGVQAIPGELYEAASIDGAGRLTKLRSITIPLLKPTLAMTLILSITGSLLAFDQFFILTKGGPNNSTVTTVLLIYKYAFETKKDLGMAAALSVIVLVALVLINVLQLRALGVGKKEK